MVFSMRRILPLQLLFAFVGALAAADDPPAKITFDDHVRPIFRASCFSCHNQDRAKGGLALDTYAATMEGGSGGEVIEAGDHEYSRLWELVAHLDEPKMPPAQDKLADEKLDLIKAWIDGGALENSGASAKTAKKSSLAMVAPGGSGKPEGPVAMPEDLPRQPVNYSSRAAAVSSLAASPWAPVVAVGGHKQILMYNSDSGKLLGVLPFPEGVPHVLRFSRNGALLLAGGGRASSYGCVVLFDVKTGRRITKVGDELDVVLAADINNDHSLIALGGPQRVVRVYSVQTGELLHEIRKHTEWIFGVEFSPDGVLLATADRNGAAMIWEGETAREYLNLEGHKAAITDIAWRGDSNVLATASEDGAVKLWEMNEGNAIKTVRANGGGTTSVDFARDGRLATAGRDRTAKVFNADGSAIRTTPAFADIALETCFTYDGKRVVAGDWTGAVRMFEIADGKQVAELPPNPPTLEMRVSQLAQAATAAAKSETSAAARAQQAQMTVEDKRALLTKLKQLLADSTAARQRAAAEKQEADAMLVSADQSLKRIGDQLAGLRQTVSTAQASKAAADRLAADQPTDANKAAASNAAEVLKKAQADLAAGKQRQADLQKEKAAADETVKQKQTLLAQASDRVGPAQQQVDQATAELTQANNQLTTLNASHALLVEKSKQARRALAEANAELAAFKQIPARLAADLAAAQQKARPIETRIAQAETARAAAEKVANEKAMAAAELKKQFDALKAKYDALVDEKLQAREALLEKAGAVEQLEAESADALNAADAAKARLEQFQQAYQAAAPK
jgi:hypothetical protein